MGDLRGGWIVTGGAPLRGTVEVPGDKSIAHRAAMLAALAEGTSILQGMPDGDDVEQTLSALRAMGVAIERRADVVTVAGAGLEGLRAPPGAIDCGNSGTTLRLLAGLCAGRPFPVTLVGDDSLSRRPMRRVVDPLLRMGARIEGAAGADGEIRPPLRLSGGRLVGVDHELQVASAQVKSALLLAALRARGCTVVREPGPSRDHTERLLLRMGAPLCEHGGGWAVDPARWDGGLRPLRMGVPGDPSSAAFICVAALVVPGSDVTVEGVGLNPTRTGFIDVLRAMAGRLETDAGDRGDEPRGRLRALASDLSGTEVQGVLALRAIDEVPVLAVAATRASGRTVFGDLRELHTKESDRITAMADLLSRMGAALRERGDGLVVEGPSDLRPARFSEADLRLDHRVAMSLVVAALCARGDSEFGGLRPAAASFPGFAGVLLALGAKLTAAKPAC